MKTRKRRKHTIKRKTKYTEKNYKAKQRKKKKPRKFIDFLRLKKNTKINPTGCNNIYDRC